jgi:hypothetical protein
MRKRRAEAFSAPQKNASTLPDALLTPGNV